MSDNNTSKVSLFDFPEVPSSIDNAVQNLTNVPTKNIGQTFGDIWYLVFGSISHAADKKRMKYAVDLESYREELAQSIGLIPENKKVEPSIQITAQALENSKYCVTSDVLRSMFVNLISNSMNADTYSLAHPAFPEILKQLSSDDALLLEDIYRSKQSCLPVAKIGLNSEDGGHNVFYENVFTPNALDFPHARYSLSLSSLQRASLISIDYDVQINSNQAYDKLRQTPEYLQMQELSTSSTLSSLYFRKGLIQLTTIGRAFCSICIEKN